MSAVRVNVTSKTSGTDPRKCSYFTSLVSVFFVRMVGAFSTPHWGCSAGHLTHPSRHGGPHASLLAALSHRLSQIIISALDDRINRIILSRCLLSQNWMVILLVDRSSTRISKQEIIFYLLCGAENSTGKLLISMKGTVELTERNLNS